MRLQPTSLAKRFSRHGATPWGIQPWLGSAGASYYIIVSFPCLVYAHEPLYRFADEVILLCTASHT